MIGRGDFKLTSKALRLYWEPVISESVVGLNWRLGGRRICIVSVNTFLVASTELVLVPLKIYYYHFFMVPQDFHGSQSTSNTTLPFEPGTVFVLYGLFCNYNWHINCTCRRQNRENPYQFVWKPLSHTKLRFMAWATVSMAHLQYHIYKFLHLSQPLGYLWHLYYEAL